MDWAGRNAYVRAKAKEKQIQLYGMDLLWLITKHYYDGEFQRPSVIASEEKHIEETAEEIKEGILNKLGGE